MIKAFVVDDEPLARQRLTAMINEHDDFEVVDEASNGYDAIEAITKATFDVAFLDIKMPGASGISVAEALSELENPPLVVFSTAFDNYALNAFDLSAIDYLLKPYSGERLNQSLNRIRESLKLKHSYPEEPQYVISRMGSKHARIPISDICYFKADSKYVIAKSECKEYVLDDTLIDLEKKFDSDLLRVSRSMLANKKFVSGILKKDGRRYVTLTILEDLLPVSRRMSRKVMNYIKRT